MNHIAPNCSWCGKRAIARGEDGTYSCGQGQGDGLESHDNVGVVYTPLSLTDRTLAFVEDLSEGINEWFEGEIHPWSDELHPLERVLLLIAALGLLLTTQLLVILHGPY